MNDRPRIPLFVKGIIGVALVGASTLVGVALQLARDNAAEDKLLCERSVASREDGRAVWLYLIARDPERRDDPDVVEFVEFLDERLPPLRCDGTIPVPITSEG